MGPPTFLFFSDGIGTINPILPRTQLTSIFEDQPSKTRPFSTKTRVIWVPGIGRGSKFLGTENSYPIARCACGSIGGEVSWSIEGSKKTGTAGSHRIHETIVDMGVSESSGTPKSSILIGFSIINHPFWGTSIFGNTHILSLKLTAKAPENSWLEDDPPFGKAS